jgi:hypothetical protein
MLDEVQRRICILNLDVNSFKLNNCNVESLKRFFANNKITDPIDVKFLRTEELKCFDSMTRAQVERKILTGGEEQQELVLAPAASSSLQRRIYA